MTKFREIKHMIAMLYTDAEGVDVELTLNELLSMMLRELIVLRNENIKLSEKLQKNNILEVSDLAKENENLKQALEKTREVLHRKQLECCKLIDNRLKGR